MQTDTTIYVTFNEGQRHEICGTVFDHTTCASWTGHRSQAVALFGNDKARVFVGNDFDNALPGLSFKRYERVTGEMLATIKEGVA